MFAAVKTEIDQIIYRMRNRDFASGDRKSGSAAKKFVRCHLKRKFPGREIEMKFHHEFPLFIKEDKMIEITANSRLLARSRKRTRFAQHDRKPGSTQNIERGRYIAKINQQIEITGRPQGDIAVNTCRQHRTF